MKRILVILLAFTLALSCAGCGVSGARIEEIKNPYDPSRRAEAAGPALALAAYPEEPASPEGYHGQSSGKEYEAYRAWQESRSEADHSPTDYAQGLEGYFSALIPTLLSDSEGKNRIYSPLNIYMALAMLAELTEGSSRAQLLSLLGSEDIQALRAQATALWEAN